MASKKLSPELLAIAEELLKKEMEKAGGEEAYLKKLNKEKLNTLVAEDAEWDMTWTELEKEAKDLGLLADLRALTMKNLKDLLAPVKAAQVTAPARRTRKTAETIEKENAAILKVLKGKKSGLKRKEINAAVDFEVTSAMMKRLKDAGEVKQTGQLANTVYLVK